MKELIPHKDEIDPKYAYIMDAPQEDDDGNPTIVRYSRKTKEQYLLTEVDKKATGWKAFYQDGKWVVQKPQKKQPKKKKK